MNVLHIVVDDVGREEMSLYGVGGVTGGFGRPYAVTPRINALATGGVRFDGFYSTPFCTATRAELMTMRMPSRSGQGELIGNRPGGINAGTQYSFMESELTFVEILKRAGIPTGHFGKWHLGTEFNGYLMDPLRQGFSYSAGTYQNLFTNEGETWFNYEWVVNGEARYVKNRYLTSHTVDHAVRWIQRQKRGPWYAYVALHAPHVPYQKPPASLFTTDYGMTTDVCPIGDQNLNWRYERAMFEAADTEIGRLLDSIHPAILANTLVVLHSDNGMAFKYKNAPALPVAGDDYEYHPTLGWYDQEHFKFTTYDSGVRVPCYAWGVGVVNPGRVVTGPIQSADMGPTFFEVFGLHVFDKNGLDWTIKGDGRLVDGRSFLKCLNTNTWITGRTMATSERFSPDGPNAGTTGGDRMITNTRYKLRVWRDAFEGPLRTIEFYDRVLDPLEKVNLTPGNSTSSLDTTQLTNYTTLYNELKRRLATCNNPYP